MTSAARKAARAPGRSPSAPAPCRSRTGSPTGPPASWCSPGHALREVQRPRLERRWAASAPVVSPRPLEDASGQVFTCPQDQLPGRIVRIARGHPLGDGERVPGGGERPGGVPRFASALPSVKRFIASMNCQASFSGSRSARRSIIAQAGAGGRQYPRRVAPHQELHQAGHEVARRQDLLPPRVLRIARRHPLGGGDRVSGGGERPGGVALPRQRDSDRPCGSRRGPAASAHSPGSRVAKGSRIARPARSAVSAPAKSPCAISAIRDLDAARRQRALPLRVLGVPRGQALADGEPGAVGGQRAGGVAPPRQHAADAEMGPRKVRLPLRVARLPLHQAFEDGEPGAVGGQRAGPVALRPQHVGDPVLALREGVLPLRVLGVPRRQPLRDLHARTGTPTSPPSRLRCAPSASQTLRWLSASSCCHRASSGSRAASSPRSASSARKAASAPVASPRASSASPTLRWLSPRSC